MSPSSNRIAGVTFDGVESSVLVHACYQSHVGAAVLLPDRHITNSQVSGILGCLTGAEKAVVLATPTQDTSH